MEKNVTVVDEKGNVIGATYPKRAKGLVKKGRARYVDENVISLACPADIHSEEMMENKIEATEEIQVANEQTKDNELTAREILDRIDKIQRDTSELRNAINALQLMNDGDNAGPGSPGNTAGVAKAQAIADVVRCRETTNQQLLAFYESVYKELTGASKTRLVSDVIAKLGYGGMDAEALTELDSIIDSIRLI